jgi:hypothetical protein
MGTLLRLLMGRRSRKPRDSRIVAFARGLALGALVGAALAGSTIWGRRRRPD